MHNRQDVLKAEIQARADAKLGLYLGQVALPNLNTFIRMAESLGAIYKPEDHGHYHPFFPDKESLEKVQSAIDKEVSEARRKAKLFVAIPYEYAEIRDLAKRKGARWDPDNKVWRFSDEQALADIKELIEKKNHEVYQQRMEEAEAKRKKEQDRLKSYGTPLRWWRNDKGPAEGYIFRSKDLGVVVVTHVEARYIKEDGLSLGLDDDQGWMTTIWVKPADSDDTARFEAEELLRKSRSAAIDRLEEIAKEIQKKGQMPSGKHRLSGKAMYLPGTKRHVLYGGGSWFVINGSKIWYVRNNGADGDDWSHNNVETGGAGAMGWAIPYDEALAIEIDTLWEKVGDK